MTSRNRSPSAAEPDAPVGRSLVPVSALSAPRQATRAPVLSALEAHLLAQAERRRGLKAGPQVVEEATSAYNETEWSGGADRRQPLGAATRKRV